MTSFLFYHAGRSVRRAILLGLSLSLTLTSHLSTVPFLGAFAFVEAVSFFFQNEPIPRRTILFYWLLMLCAIPVLVFLFQVITWVPTLWIDDPDAWHFTALYGEPYRSYFGQLAWYVQEIDRAVGDGGSMFGRILMVGVYPVVIEGPIVMLAMFGWVVVLRRILREGWSPSWGLLLFGGLVPAVWYLLHDKLFPTPYAITPMGIYVILLSGCAVSWFCTKVSNARALTARLAFAAFPLCVLVLQVIHITPIVTYKEPVLGAREWLRERGENCAVSFGWQALLEVSGVDTWGDPDESGRESREFRAWGLRPPLSWDDEELPRYVVVTARNWQYGYVKEFLEYKNIDIEKPSTSIPVLSSYTFYGKYLSIFSKLTSPFNARLSGILARDAGVVETVFCHDASLFIYDLGEASAELPSATDVAAPELSGL